jgi:hypothetical protein
VDWRTNGVNARGQTYSVSRSWRCCRKAERMEMYGQGSLCTTFGELSLYSGRHMGVQGSGKILTLRVASVRRLCLLDRLPIFSLFDGPTPTKPCLELCGGAGFKNSLAYGPDGWIRLTVIRYESAYSQQFQFNPSLWRLLAGSGLSGGRPLQAPPSLSSISQSRGKGGAIQRAHVTSDKSRGWES